MTMRLPPRLLFKARALHRLARHKRWPAYVFAAAVQETPHLDYCHHHHQPLESMALQAAHIALVYLSFTLLDH